MLLFKINESEYHQILCENIEHLIESAPLQFAKIIEYTKYMHPIITSLDFEYYQQIGKVILKPAQK